MASESTNGFDIALLVLAAAFFDMDMLDVIRENIDDLVAFEGFACKPSLSRSDGDSFEAIPSTKCVLRRSCPEVYECAQDALQMMNIMISACLMEMINAVSLYSGCFYAEAQRVLGSLETGIS